jgi:hypothetical protein
MKNPLAVAASCKPLLLAVLILLAVPATAATRADPLVVPENAYANGSSYGSGWDCSFGYRVDGAVCEIVIVPANAYLNSRGIGWKCNRGYLAEGFAAEACLKIQVPADGYLTESGNRAGWACERQFRATRDGCERILIPENAYFTSASSKSGWECERGYRAAMEKCVAIAVPENAYLVDKNYGPGWQCERGYSTTDDKSCSKLVVPAFGHLDSSGKEWECNKPYKKSGMTCVER